MRKDNIGVQVHYIPIHLQPYYRRLGFKKDDFPNSEFKGEANGQILELRNKLAQKEYATGILYIKMEEYPSAIISFESLINNYYDTDILEKGHIGMIRCYSLMDEYKKAETYYNDHSSEIISDDLKQKALKYINKSNSSN